MSSLLSLLGSVLPGMGNDTASNPFVNLATGGSPSAPSPFGGGFSTLVPTLLQAFTGQLGTELPGPIAPPGSGPQYPGQQSGLPANSKGQPLAPAPAGTPDQRSGPGNWPSIRAGIFKGESGGDYNTLYGHSERNGAFAGTKLSDMTVDQALEFSSPNGPYGQWAAANGIDAAPMGAYQIIHSTLRDLVKPGMGLTGSERMTPELQEKMGQYIYTKQGTGAWSGYKGPADPNAYGPAATPSPTSDAMSRPSGSSWSPAPTYEPGAGSGSNVATGETNSKLASVSQGRQTGGRAIPGADPGGAGGGGGAHQNSISPDFKRWQSQKTTRHLRSLSPVATISALENIGKGLRIGGLTGQG